MYKSLLAYLRTLVAKASKDGISGLALTEVNYDTTIALLVTVCVFSSEPSVVGPIPCSS